MLYTTAFLCKNNRYDSNRYLIRENNNNNNNNKIYYDINPLRKCAYVTIFGINYPPPNSINGRYPKSN